jgi:putative peptidoglycan lipid II flippase
LAGTGAISWLNYARRIMLVPVGVVAQAAGVASYPFLAELVAREEYSRFYQTLNTALQSVLTLLIPLSIWMMAIAEPTITLIFQQGHFSQADTLQTAGLLRISLLAVCCWGIQQIIGRAFYARQDTITPAVLGTLTTLASLPLFHYLTQWMDATGVAVASALSMGIYTGVLALWWRVRFGGETFAGLALGQLKIFVLSIVAALPALLLVRLQSMGGAYSPYLVSFCIIAGSGLCFGLLFVLLSSYFTPALVRPFLMKAGPLGRRLMW